jgi:hypothetical protein
MGSNGRSDTIEWRVRPQQPADRQTGNMGRGGTGESQWRKTDVAYFWPEPVW